MIESLETRRLLSVSFNPATGVLTVRGTDAANTVRVDRSGTSLTVILDGAVSSFGAAAVKRVVVDALGGDDAVALAAGVAAPGTLNGGDGNDTLRGGGGADLLQGGDGDDLLDGGLGADRFLGGAGNDTADYSARTENLVIGIGVQADDGARGEGDNVNLDVENAIGGPGNDLINGRDGANVLDGGSGNDTISGMGGDDLLRGGGGNDLLQGGAGDDTLDGGLGADRFSGNAGNDTADYSARTENLTIGLGVANDDGAKGEGDNVNLDIENAIGGAGNDLINGRDGANVLFGGRGNDTVNGMGGNDFLFGDAGDDRLDGGGGADAFQGGDGVDTADYSARTRNLTVTADGLAANDGEANERDDVLGDVEVFLGGRGNDRVIGNFLDNTLRGGDGNDTLDGGGGGDLIDGGGGDDALVGGAGADAFAGGAGADTADYSARTAGVVVTIDGRRDDGESQEGDNVGADVERVLGGAGGDILVGADSADDTLIGNGGNDFIFGLGGGDELLGGAGNDRINGGAGHDLVGGQGGDDFATGDAGDDSVYGGDRPGETTVAPGDPDVDNLTGGDGDDLVSGGGGGDQLLGSNGNDTIDGGDGDDRLFGEVDDDLLMGGAGDDELSGGDGDDVLGGGAGVDVLGGDAGDDILGDSFATPGVVVTHPPRPAGPAGPGQEEPPADRQRPGDRVEGGTGDDVVDGTDADDEISGGDGNDVITGGAGDDVLNGELGDDRISGGAGVDVISGDFGLDVLEGGDDNDTFVNTDGEPDFVDGGEGFDAVQQEFNDADAVRNTELTYDPIEGAENGLPPDQPPPIEVPAGPAAAGGISTANGVAPRRSLVTANALANGVLTITGTAGNDEIEVTADDNIVLVAYVTPGRPFEVFPAASVRSIRVDVGAGDDVVSLTNVGNRNPVRVPATIIGGTGNDRLVGGTGNDSLDGGAGNDALYGNFGSDVLNAGDGNDVLNGGTGTFYGQSDGADRFVGGPGIDAADYSTRTAALNLRITSTAVSGVGGEGDVIQTDVENIYGGTAADVIVGSTAPNFLSGGDGNDLIFGLNGNDQVLGSRGSDLVFGNVGDDFLYVNGDGISDGYNDGAGRPKAFTDTNPSDVVVGDRLP